MTDQLTTALELLERLVDHEDGPCVIDHNGYCQEHGLSSAPCATATARAFLAAHRAAHSDIEDGEPKFEAGKYYITENGGFVFQCNEVTPTGTALGRELRVDGLPADVSQQTYQRPGTRGLWVEIDEETVHAKYGIHGWVHRPKTR